MSVQQNDHHAPVERQMETERHAGERDKNPTSEKSTTQDSCVRALEPRAKGASRCTDLPNGEVAQMENKVITRRKCTTWRSPSGKPRSDWHKSSFEGQDHRAAKCAHWNWPTINPSPVAIGVPPCGATSIRTRSRFMISGTQSQQKVCTETKQQISVS